MVFIFPHILTSLHKQSIFLHGVRSKALYFQMEDPHEQFKRSIP